MPVPGILIGAGKIAASAVLEIGAEKGVKYLKNHKKPIKKWTKKTVKNVKKAVKR